MSPQRLSNNKILNKYYRDCSSPPDRFTPVQVAIWQALVDKIIMLRYLDFYETLNKTPTSPITIQTIIFYLETGLLPGISVPQALICDQAIPTHIKGDVWHCKLTLSCGRSYFSLFCQNNKTIVFDTDNEFYLYQMPGEE